MHFPEPKLQISHSSRYPSDIAENIRAFQRRLSKTSLHSVAGERVKNCCGEPAWTGRCMSATSATKLTENRDEKNSRAGGSPGGRGGGIPIPFILIRHMS